MDRLSMRRRSLRSRYPCPENCGFRQDHASERGDDLKIAGPLIPKSPINHVFVQFFITPAQSAWPVSLWGPTCWLLVTLCSASPCKKWCGNSGAMENCGGGNVEPGPHRMVFCNQPCLPQENKMRRMPVDPWSPRTPHRLVSNVDMITRRQIKRSR
jgi:hypothetical protein